MGSSRVAAAMFGAVVVVLCTLAGSCAGANAPRGGFVGRVIAPSENEKDARSFFNSLRVTLNGGQYTAFVSSEGFYEFDDLAKASYSLEVYSNTHVFEPLRVDVHEARQIKVYKASIVQSAAVAVPYSAAAGLELRPLGAAKYFEERQGFNVLDLLKNPMILLMGLPLLLTFLLPKMTEGVDKEQLQSLQQQSQQQQMPDFSSMLAGMTSSSKKPASGKDKDKEKTK